MRKELTVENYPDTEKRFPSAVNFMLLGACNLRCPFCFGPRHEIPAMQTDLAIGIVNKLASNGVERLVFTGGEPTLIKDLPVILRATKSRGLTTVLSTNGMFIASNDELLDKIASSLDWIALPLDADTSSVNAKLRVGLNADAGIKHFDAVLSLIPKIRERYPRLGIKLGTVVTQLNLDSILNIPNLLVSRNAIPDTWKLYQVSASEYGKINYVQLQVGDEEFTRVYEKAREHALGVGIPNVTKYTNQERPGKYLFINPLGEVLVVHPIANDYYSIGNILTNFNGVLNNWRNYVKNDALTANFATTYPPRKAPLRYSKVKKIALGQ